MTSKAGKQTIAIRVLPNISRSKDNQAMKFGHLIEYNMRAIFIEKLYTKYETSLRHSSELRICLDKESKAAITLIYIFNCFFINLGGCSYGGEIARLGGLAHLGEISPSLRNSYKNIMCSYEK